MARVLNKTLEEFKINKSVISVTYDNAGNNNILLDEFEAIIKDNPIITKFGDLSYNWKDYKPLAYKNGVRCIAHIINLLVQDFLKDIGGDLTKHELYELIDSTDQEDKKKQTKESNIEAIASSSNNTTNKTTNITTSKKRARQDTIGENINTLTITNTSTNTSILINTRLDIANINPIFKIRKQVTKLRLQGTLIRALEKALLIIELPTKSRKKPILDLRTRWNSTYNIIDNYLNIKPAIDIVVAQFPKRFEGLNLDSIDLKVLNEIRPILYSFMIINKLVQEEKKNLYLILAYYGFKIAKIL